MRLSWAFAAGIIAVLLLGGSKWLYDRQVEESRIRVAAEQLQRVQEALDRSVNLQFAGPTSVQAWLDEFTRQTGMAVRFHQCDEPALAERQTQLVALRQPAREALLRFGDEQGFHWRPDGDLTIHFYSPYSTAPPPVEIWTHQLPVPIHGGAEESLAALIEERWPSPHLGSSIVASPGQWIVTQPYDVQLRIQQFLQKLKKHLKDVAEAPSQGLLADDPRLTPRRFDPQPEAARVIQTALDRRMSLDVVDVKLVDVIAKIADAAGITIVLTKKIEDAGVHPDMPVTFRANDLRVGAILQHLLSERNLTFITKESSLHITTVEDALSPDHLVMVAYPVLDLARNGAVSDCEELARVIRGIHGDEWNHYDTGRIYLFRDLLLVSNREQVHERIASFLRALRSVKAEEQQTVNTQVTSPQRAKVLAILKQPCEFHYGRKRLADVVIDLEWRNGVQIFLSRKIQDVGVNDDHPITCDFPARPLEENLRAMLDEINLNAIVDDEMVIVTTTEEAQSPECAEMEVIDLRPLVKHWRPAELAHLVPTIIAPYDWAPTDSVCLEFGGLLVVRQRRDVVAQVHHLLEVLAEHARPIAPRTERGNLLAKLPFVFWKRGRSGLYDVSDLLKPGGKFTVETLLQELQDDTLEPKYSNPYIAIHRHSNQFLSAHLKSEDLQVLEARLQQLRKDASLTPVP